MFTPVINFFAIMLVAASVQAAPVVGEPAPDFTGTDSNGKTVKLSELKDKIVVLEWKNHECPFVVKHYESGNMQKVQEELTGKGVVWLSILSSAEGKQGFVSGEEANAIVAKEKSHATNVILDPKGEIGKLYEAKTTPHMFVIGKDGKLAYMGAIDDKPTTDKSDVDSATNYVRAAAESLIAGTEVAPASTQPYGCGVKYAE